MCRAETRQLVVYPATDAPNVGSRRVTAECVGNAYLLRNSLSVLCLWYGSWSTDNAPVCACNDGYFISSEGICKGLSYANTQSMVNGRVQVVNRVCMCVCVCVCVVLCVLQLFQVAQNEL